MNKNEQIDKLMSDLRILTPNYQLKRGENIIRGYIGGEIPIMLVSKTMTQEDFNKIC